MTVALLFAFIACSPTPTTGHGHSHGSGGHAPHEEDDGTSVAITRWTDGYELFVELDGPIAGRAFSYHAHVTRMSDNHAADSGELQLHFEQEGFAAAAHTDGSVARPGIFSAQATAPKQAGEYALIFTYTDGDDRVQWTVGDDMAVSYDGAEEGEVTFLKETQWQIPFAVQRAEARPMAPTLTVGANVETAPGVTAVVAAPVEGLLAWAGGLPVVGREVVRGEQLAALVPAGAAEHWARLQADLSTARVDQLLAQQELVRVEDLASRDLLPQRRLEEARGAVARANAELSATERQMSALTSGGAGALPIRAPTNGFVVAVGAAHGVAVAAGTPLVSVSSGSSVLIEGRVHDRSQTELGILATLSVFRGDWDSPKDLLPAGGQLLTERLVFDTHTLSAPISVLVQQDVGLIPGDIVELQVGVGDATQHLAVPRSAVVEINGQDIIFVQNTGESFTRRRVVLGVSDPTHVAIENGLSAGEMVVTEGGFDVHVASLSGALESHKH